MACGAVLFDYRGGFKMRRTRLNSSTNHLHFGSLGNGVTVYDVTREKHGDYLTVAHIDPTGMVKYYVDVTPEERAKISEMANKEHNRWVANYNKRPVESRFEELLDRVGWNDVHKAISKDIKNGYTMDEILDTYMPAVYYGAKKDRGYEYPDDTDFNSARRINSSRLPAKTQRAIRHCINSARRRAGLNCGVTRYTDNEAYQTYYFITDDNSFVASFDVEIHEDKIEFAGFMRGYSAGGYVVNENSVFGDFAPGTDIAQALADFVYDKTGVTVYETENVKEFNNQLLTINKIFTNSRKSRIEKYTELRRASLKSSRRLNSGKLFYDDATGEYEEYEYDDEQDAWYQLPDEMYIYKLDLSQFTDLVRDGIVSKHEIHEWIDELSEDWGGMPAWSPSKLIDRFEIQDLTKEQYDIWNANFAVESVRFRDELERRY